MNYVKVGDLTVYSPENYAYIFTPAIVRVESSKVEEGSIAVTITSADTGAAYTETREFSKSDNTAIFDVSRLMQIAFGDAPKMKYDDILGVSDFAKRLGIKIVHHNSSGSTNLVNDTILGIWGVAFVDDSTKSNITRRWFWHYPFTVDFLSDKAQRFFIVNINADEFTSSPRSSDPFRMHSVGLREINDGGNELSKSAAVYVSSTNAIAIDKGIAQTTMQVYTIKPDASTDGVFLRWIDAKGRVCYYLLKEIGKTTEVGATSWVRHDIMQTDIYDNMVNYAMNERRSYSSVTTRNLGVRMVDKDTFDFLLGLTTSPIVEVFDGYEEFTNDWLPEATLDDICSATPMWHRVSVVASTIERSDKDLQDFAVVIQEQTKEYQKL